MNYQHYKLGDLLEITDYGCDKIFCLEVCHPEEMGRTIPYQPIDFIDNPTQREVLRVHHKEQYMLLVEEPVPSHKSGSKRISDMEKQHLSRMEKTEAKQIETCSFKVLNNKALIYLHFMLKKQTDDIGKLFEVVSRNDN